MQSKTEQDNSIQQASDKINADLIAPSKTAYSCYFEMQLNQEDFGLSRQKHNAICNRLLLKQLEGLKKEGFQFFAELDILELMENIISSPRESPHKSLVWEHCHTSTVRDGAPGYMRLVPQEQHKKGSEYWNLFHQNDEGGYHEWAKPRGAPVDKPKGYPRDIKLEQIPTIQAEELADAFLVAVRTNKHKKFVALLDRAKQLTISEQALYTLLTQSYVVGLKGKQETLLHLAVANGNLDIINPLLKHFSETPNFSRLVNYKGNTTAHIAAENNRHKVLEELKARGIDLAIRNRKNQTAYELAKNYNYKKCLSYCVPSGQSEEEFVQSIEEAKQQDRAQSKSTLRDPEFVYGGMPSDNKGTSEAKLPRKTYRELMGLPVQPTKEELAARETRELERKQTPKKTFRELMRLPAQPTKEELAAREARELARAQEPKKTFREIMGLPVQPTKEELAAREARELARKQEPKKTFREIMGLPAQPTKEELAAREARELERKQAPKKTFRELTGLPDQSTTEELTAREASDVEGIKGQTLQRNTPQKIEPSPRYSMDNKKEITSQKTFKPQQNPFSPPTVLPLKKPIAYKKEKQQLATSDALQKIVNARIEKQAKQLRDTEHKKEKTLHLKDETQIKQQKIEQQKSNQQPLQKYEPPRSDQTKKTVKFHSPSPVSEQSRGTSTHQHTPLKEQQQHIQQQAQQRIQQQAQQRIQQQAQQRVQQQAQQRVQQQAQQRVQQQAQQRIQQQAQQRIQQQAQQRIQQQAQQRIQQQAQQRIQQQAQQQVQQRAQQQAQQRAQQQAQQRAQQQAQQRAQQQAQQRAQQQAQQRAQQQAQQRAQQQAQQQAQQRAQQQAQQRAQQQAQQRAQQQAQQRAQQQAQQRAQQQAQQRAQQQAQQRAQQLAQQQAQQRAQQLAQQQAQQRAQQLAQQRAQQLAQQQAQQRAQQLAQQQAQQRAQQQAQQAAAARAAQQAAAARAAQQAAAARAAQQAAAARTAQQAAAARAQQAAANQRTYKR